MTELIRRTDAELLTIGTLEVNEEAALQAFESFLQIDVANGDATRDTIVGYRREVGAWILWCRTRDLHPAEAKRADVEAFRESLKVAGLGVSTRKLKLSIVRRFYAAGQKHGLWRDNPAENVRAGKDLTAPEDKMKALSEVGLRKLLEAVPGDTLAGARDRAVIALMALHGLRRVEAHRFDHEHLQNDGDVPYLQVLGKGHKQRRVYLRTDTFAVMEAYAHAKFAAKLPLCGAFFVGHGPNGNGKRLDRQSFNNIVSKHLTTANLKRAGVSCHALRHTFGTLSVAGGAKVEHVRDTMGHSKLETTSIYVRAVERSKNNPAQNINVSV